MDLTKLAGSGELRVYNRGEVVCQQGDASRCMYVVITGIVGLFIRQPGVPITKAAAIRENSFFGEMCLLGSIPMPYMAITEVDRTSVLIVRRETVQNFIANQPAFIYDVMESLAMQVIASQYLGSVPTTGGGGSPFAGNEPIPPPVSAPTPAPAQSSTTAVQGGSTLFPEGHGHYDIEIPESHAEYLIPVQVVCPICKKKTGVRNQRLTKLKVLKTDSDFRVHYDGYEKLYYNIYTCQSCLYSNYFNEFTNALGGKARLAMDAALKPLQNEIPVPFDDAIDINTIFLKYYLAIYCAKVGSPDTSLLAKLYMNVAWLYQDLGDEDMYTCAMDQAYDYYTQTLNNASRPLSNEQEQSICLILGELSQRKGDLRQAQQYFFAATKRAGNNVTYTKMAQDRIQALRAELNK